MNKQIHFKDIDKSNNIDNIEESYNSSDSEIEINDNNKLIYSIMNNFLDKYEHLNNKKSKKIIYKLCKILVERIPEFKDNIKLYINTLESSIKDMNKNNSIEDFNLK